MEDEPKLSRGWGWPSLSRKAHIFSGGLALCGKWMFAGELTAVKSDERARQDDCKTCFRKNERNNRS